MKKVSANEAAEVQDRRRKDIKMLMQEMSTLEISDEEQKIYWIIKRALCIGFRRGREFEGAFEP